jgi:hypothetical protein
MNLPAHIRRPTEDGILPVLCAFAAIPFAAFSSVRIH